VKLFFLLLVCTVSFAQNPLRLRVFDHETEKPLAGVSIGVVGTTLGTRTDGLGRAELSGLPTGRSVLQLSYVGYETVRKTVTGPFQETELQLGLEPAGEELEGVVVTTTRGTRTIADEPTRVEIIGGEELEEKVNMDAANIAIMLRETPGIQAQQTSATSANTTFRIQGLEGRYTQLLQNGLPLYAGFSAGLNLLQIPPLDLQQVEIIKGAASTLYGGGAIAGLVNLVTKEPTGRPERTLLLNGTSAGGLDLNAFVAQKFGKLGLTAYAARNTQRAYDPNGDGFSDIPQSARFTFNPRLFYAFTDRTKASVGVNLSAETRTGGDLAGIRGEGTGFFTEKNTSRRWATQARFDHRQTERSGLYAKNAVSGFHRRIDEPGYRFAGRQTASFTELGYTARGTRTEWVAGLNLWTDNFRDDSPNAFPRDYTLTTLGAFVQPTFTLTERLTLETGLRLDRTRLRQAGELDRIPTVNRPVSRWFWLPRVSALYKLSDRVSSRLGGGLGYKVPTVFTEETEQRTYRNVLPPPLAIRPERSTGANWDVNYQHRFGRLGLSVNALFFYTRIRDPAVLRDAPGDLLGMNVAFFTANGFVDTKGLETNLKLTYGNLKLYGFYTFTDTRRRYDNVRSAIPLTARHRTGFVLMWEKHENFRMGYEAYFFGPQELESGRATRPYWVMGFMAEKTLWERLNVFINFENFTDTRLSRWQAMYTGPRQNPQFVRELWAPTDGRIVNGGIKFKL